MFLESEALLPSWEMVGKLKKVLVHVKLSPLAKEVKANNNKQEVFGQVKGHDLAAKGLQQLLPFPRFLELCSPGVDVYCKTSISSHFTGSAGSAGVETGR